MTRYKVNFYKRNNSKIRQNSKRKSSTMNKFNNLKVKTSQ